MYLFWWQHFDITSDFMFSKLFSLSSNISSFSLKTKGTYLRLRVVHTKQIFTAHVTFGLEFSAFKFQYLTGSFISFLYLLILNVVSWFPCHFLDVLLLIPLSFLSLLVFLSHIIVTIYKMVSRKQFWFNRQVFLLI